MGPVKYTSAINLIMKLKFNSRMIIFRTTDFKHNIVDLLKVVVYI
jgi:hypothetical protein